MDWSLSLGLCTVVVIIDTETIECIGHFQSLPNANEMATTSQSRTDEVERGISQAIDQWSSIGNSYLNRPWLRGSGPFDSRSCRDRRSGERSTEYRHMMTQNPFPSSSSWSTDVPCRPNRSLSRILKKNSFLFIGFRGGGTHCFDRDKQVRFFSTFQLSEDTVRAPI